MGLFRFMEPLTSSVPFMVIEGNHEKEPQMDNRTFASYQARFAVPFKESGSPNSFYYSFDAGGIHFLMLGAYTDYSQSSKYCFRAYTVSPKTMLGPSIGDLISVRLTNCINQARSMHGSSETWRM